MAGTLADMKARIASELARADLASQTADAITTAISIYQRERFRFSDTLPGAPPTFNTVAAQWIYDVATLPDIDTAYSIDQVIAQIGNSLAQLIRDDPQRIRLDNQVGNIRGHPMRYGYEGNSLLIYPVPDTAYPITLNMFRNVAGPASDVEANNKWMTDAELLIRCRAKYEIALHVTRNKDMQLAMSPMQPDSGESGGHATWHAWRMLKADANRVTRLGRIRAMKF